MKIHENNYGFRITYAPRGDVRIGFDKAQLNYTRTCNLLHKTHLQINVTIPL